MPKPNKHIASQFAVSGRAHELVRLSPEENRGDVSLPTKAQVSLLMAELGRKGGKIGGKRRLKTMTPQERSENARLAANARWNKKEG